MLKIGLCIQDYAGASASVGGGGTAVTLCKLKNMHTGGTPIKLVCMYHGQKELVATLAAKLTKNLIQDEKMLAIPQKLVIAE